MDPGVWSQSAASVRFDWGPTGATRLSVPGGILVVVDVLSFTTPVGVAVERGTAVYPAAWGDARAGELAAREDAVLAVGRREVTDTHPWSLSPAALRAAPAMPRLVLPSPNGSAIAAAAISGPVVAASLRNAPAVGAWLGRAIAGEPRPVCVIAAGERWPDGSLRPALEDLLGAGAVISALVAHAGGLLASPEAEAARTLWEGTRSPEDVVRSCASGLELTRSGFGADVDVATEVGASHVVPVLGEGSFRAGTI